MRGSCNIYFVNSTIVVEFKMNFRLFGGEVKIFAV